MPVIPEQDFSSLFEPPPAQWGLRGDPYLWEAMRAALRGQALPALAEALDIPDHIRVPAFAHRGMSSAMISPRFWRDKASPLLRKRLVARIPFQHHSRIAAKPSSTRLCRAVKRS